MPYDMNSVPSLIAVWQKAKIVSHSFWANLAPLLWAIPERDFFETLWIDQDMEPTRYASRVNRVLSDISRAEHEHIGNVSQRVL